MLTTPETPPPQLKPREDDAKVLAMVVRQALLMIVAAIEKHYGLQRKH
jgi:hypothetical protein